MSTDSSSDPGNWVSGQYMGDSIGLRIAIGSFTGVAWYNSIELLILIFITFKRHSGLYFWSMLISAAGVLPYSVGFLMKFFGLFTSATWFSVTLITVGWWTMVTGQALVLYSRLHLVLRSPTILRLVLGMIITSVFFFHVPTTVLTYGANVSLNPNVFARAYDIMERIQLAGFFVQETIISSLYIWETNKMLKLNPERNSRKIMVQLVTINLACILMDTALIAIEYATLYIYQTTLKATVYSVKLKLEFAVLGKLVGIANHSQPDRLWPFSTVSTT